MDQRSINEAVRQAVRRCLENDNALVTLHAFLRRLRRSNWTDEAIGQVDNATRRMIAIIYEPDSAESADDDLPAQEQELELIAID
jgi:DNA/RNA-binding domain of Phe-tRNA-synthetase-like protein